MPAAPKRFSKAEVQSLYTRLQTAIANKRMSETVKAKFESDLEFYRDEIMEWKKGTFSLQGDEQPVASESCDATTSLQLNWEKSDSKTSNSLLDSSNGYHSEICRKAGRHFTFGMVAIGWCSFSLLVHLFKEALRLQGPFCRSRNSPAYASWWCC